MLTIRLHPVGRAHKRQYRIVVAQKHKAVSKKFIANLGFYDPHTKELKIDAQKAQKYIEAQIEMSPSAKALFKKLSLIKA